MTRRNLGRPRRPNSFFSDFEPGTYLALISYGVEGYHRARLGDERSFDTTVNTRLFQPDHARSVHQHDGASRPQRVPAGTSTTAWRTTLELHRLEGADKLPYHIDGVTYHLPVDFYVFSARGEAGERRNFVAYDHALAFTSNGQVHHHWTPQEFRYKTHLKEALRPRVRRRGDRRTPDRGANLTLHTRPIATSFPVTTLCVSRMRLRRSWMRGTSSPTSTVNSSGKQSRGRVPPQSRPSRSQSK